MGLNERKVGDAWEVLEKREGGNDVIICNYNLKNRTMAGGSGGTRL